MALTWQELKFIPRSFSIAITRTKPIPKCKDIIYSDKGCNTPIDRMEELGEALFDFTTLDQLNTAIDRFQV